MAAISHTPGTGNAGNIPSAGEMKDYSDKVGNMNTKELLGELGKNLEPWQRDAVEKAILDKSKENGAAGGASGAGAPQGGGGASEEDEIKKLLKKLLDGSISPEEMQKLAKLTGAEMGDLEAAKGKGAGSGSGSGGGDAADIQGG